MKKPLVLSLLSAVASAVLLGDQNQNYQIVKDVFISSSDFNLTDNNYILHGTIGQVVASNFDGNYSAGFWVEPNELNNIPEVNISSTISLSEDNSQNIAFSYNDFENDELNLSVVKNPSNGSIARNGNNITYISNSNFNGSDSISLNFNDGFGGIIERNISIIVSAVDDSPNLAGISTVSVEEDSSAKTVTLNLSDIDSNIGNASYSASISDSTIADVSTSGANLIVTPKADKFGSATITVLATLDNKTAQQTFSYSISAIDDKPELTKISDIVANEDSSAKTITLNLSDIDSDKNKASFVASISDSTLADVSISGTNLVVTPKANKFGVTTISVVATLDGQTAEQKFNYTLSSIDDSPVLEYISAISKRSGSGNFTIPLNLTDIDSNIANAKWTISNKNTNLLDASIDGNSIAVSPKSGAFGITEITVTANVDGIEVSKTFPITIDRVNSAPIIGSVEKLALESSINSQIKNITILLNDDISVVDFSAFSSDPKVAKVVSTDPASGKVELEILSNSVGSAIISLVARDGDGLTTNSSFAVEVKANSNQICLENSRVALSFDTIRGENLDQNYVRKDLNLPTVLTSCEDSLTISWKSSNETIIDTSGKVYISDEQDYTVQLVANLENGDYKTIKEFLITVPKQEITDKLAVDRAFEFLTFDTIKLENLKRSEIYSKLNLPTEMTINGKKIEIVWSSSDEQIIKTNGIISRDSNDSHIKLDAILSIGAEQREKSFNLIVKGESLIDSDIVKLDKKWLTISSILNMNRDKNSIVSELTLHQKAINGSNISWESSNPEIISIEGNVSRDAIRDRFVQLVATISSGEIEEKSEFLLKVLKAVSETKLDQNLSFDRIESNETETEKRFSLVMNGENNSTISSNLSISSELKTLETYITDESLLTKVELENIITSVKLNSNGLTESQIELIDENNISVASNINSNIVGVDTKIENDGSVSSQKDNVSAKLRTDGSVEHIVGETSAKSTFAGSSVTIENDKVQTKYEKVEIQDGEKIILQAIVDTDSNSSKSDTSFSLINLTTGETVELDKTLAENSQFSNETNVSIEKNSDGKTAIRVNTKLKDNLEIK